MKEGYKGEELGGCCLPLQQQSYYPWEDLEESTEEVDGLESAPPWEGEGERVRGKETMDCTTRQTNNKPRPLSPRGIFTTPYDRACEDHREREPSSVG